MIRLLLDSVTPGMVLSEPVYNQEGTLLLNPGVQVTDSSIRMLKSWGIYSVFVNAESASDSPETSSKIQAVRAAISQSVEDRFTGMSNHPVLDEIKRVSILILSRQELVSRHADES